MKSDITLSGVKAAIFDLDGTLFDSVGLWLDIDDKFLTKRGRVPTVEYRKGIATLGFREIAEYTIEYYGLDDTPEQLMDEWTALAADAYAHTVRLMPGACEYLTACHAAGIKIAAATSMRRAFAESCLKNNGVYGMFDAIVTVDETGLSKSSSEIYAHTARVLGVDCRDCVVFDDVLYALSAARSAGMTTVGMLCGVAIFDEAEYAAQADYVASGFAAAPRLCADM